MAGGQPRVPLSIASCAIEWGNDAARSSLSRVWSSHTVSRLPSQLAHTVKDDRAIAIHPLGPSLQGSRQDGRQPRRLLPADIPGCAFVVVTTRRLRAINTWAPLHHVEVDLENAPFAEDEFGDRYQRDLCAFAEDRAARSEEQVFDELLRNGRSSASAIALQILLGRDLDFMPIEAMVLVEVRVLCGDDSVLEIGRDLVEGNELVAFAIRRADDSRPASVAGCAPRLWVDRSSGPLQGSARPATKEARCR